MGLYGMVLLDGLRVTGEPWECPPVWVGTENFDLVPFI